MRDVVAVVLAVLVAVARGSGLWAPGARRGGCLAGTPLRMRRPNVASRALVAAIMAVLAAGVSSCVYGPHFESGITKCATSGRLCPVGFSCDVSRGVCVTADGAGGDSAADADAGRDTIGDAGRGDGTLGDANDTASDGSANTPDAAGDGTSGNVDVVSDAGSGDAIPDAANDTVVDRPVDTANDTVVDRPVDAVDAIDAVAVADAGCAADADIATSPNHCGACGHSCGGGTCDRGVCQPMVIPGVTAASSISVDATALYFTSSTKVLACPKTGCVLQPTQLDDMGMNGYSTWSVVVANGSLFFMSAPTQAGTEHDDLFMCPLAGCPAPAPPVATARFGVTYLTNAGNDIYWSDSGARLTYRRACEPNAGVCDTPGTILPEAVDPLLLAARSDEFYFVDPLGLQKCPLAGCPGATAAATGATPLTSLVPTAVIYFGGVVYMQFGDVMHTLNGAIRTCNPVDCDAHMPRNFIANRDPINGLTVDATGVYWLEDLTLYSCPLTGCLGGPKILATGVSRAFSAGLNPRPVVTDDAFVYWINDDAGVVKRVAK